MKATTQLRALLKEPGMLVAPGCFDTLSALINKHLGFKALYVSGSAMEAVMLGHPDLGLKTLTETTTQAGRRHIRQDTPDPRVAGDGGQARAIGVPSSCPDNAACQSSPFHLALCEQKVQSNTLRKPLSRRSRVITRQGWGLWVQQAC